MNPHDDDRLPGEDELAALYRKLPDKQPSPALDAAVLRAAAEAVRPAVAQPRRRPRWPVALGTAATLVLAFGLTWHMREWPSATRPAALPATTSAGHNQSAPASTVVAVAAAPAPAVPPEPIAPPAAAAPRRANPGLDARIEKHRTAPSGIVANRQRVLSPPPPAPAPIAETTAPAAAPAEASVAPQADAAAMPSDQAQARAASKPAAQALAAPASAPAPFVNQPESTTALLQSNGKEAVLGGMRKQQAEREQAPVTAAAYAPAPIAPPPAEPAAKSYSPDPTDAQIGDTPMQELEKIRQLLALDRRDEARQRLVAFHRDHPDYVLPPELRSQLPMP